MPRNQARISGRERRRPSGDKAPPSRAMAHRQLRNPYAPMRPFTDDQVEAMHQPALGILETIGMRVIGPEARAIHRRAGAQMNEADMMVRPDRTMVEEFVARAPSVIDFAPRAAERTFRMGDGHVAFAATGGAPRGPAVPRHQRDRLECAGRARDL